MKKLEVHPINPEKRKIAEIANSLIDGSVLIYPTDSVYNMGCILTNKRGIEKMAKIKNIKPQKANFSILCNSLKQIDEYTKQYDRATYKILNKNLPGPFTFILEASNKIPRLFNSNKKTVGIRIPNNQIVLDMLKEIEIPIVTTSIHDEDEVLEYTTDPDLIFNNYKHLVDIVIDGGMGNNEATTVIDCTNNFEVLRQGIGILEY